ncbi:MAG: nucleotidyltransferase [Bacteroidetes bacterium]|nr:MAG: nucleotidyltransferase [Bacteroidota bacterium]
MKAMIFAAGLGTRLKPWTDSHPKALAPVNRKPLLQRNIEYLRSYGIDEIIINLHHFADQIRDFLISHNYFGCHITLSYETDKPLETGGGLKKAGWFFNEPGIVMNADILTNLDITAFKKFHLQNKPLVSLAVTKRNSARKFVFNANGQLCGWKNSKTGEEKISIDSKYTVAKAFSGIQIVGPELFPLIEENGVFSLVDLYLRLAKNHPILAYDHSDDLLIDVGKPDSIKEAEKLFL